MTTRSQADALRRQLISLVTSGTSELSDLFELNSQADLIEVMPHILLPYIDQAALLTAAWYESLAPGAFMRITDDHSVSEGRINYTAAWAFRASGQELPVDRMTGTYQRMVFDASREVVITNAKAEGSQWFRDARSDACSFCRLLTVDPTAYHGKYVDMPSHNHDCRCIAVVSRPNNPYEPPEYVQTWRDEVSSNKSRDLTHTLAGMDDSNV